eukprot:TRINITY_DN34444_c0_g1_i1.p1 TRINITY_DN34444_c0_g1~~TRINITY_DN34444_c0_g1_i1.p1  ORF type:complete len:379 (+),score=73.45 TRINITY_DN34444_c0_g1_i1:137-1273(+)
MGDTGTGVSTTRQGARVDFHTHILPAPEVFPDFEKKFGYGGFIRLDREPTYMENGAVKELKPGNARMMQGEKFFRQVAPNSWDPAVRIAEMDRDNIDVQVLCTVPVMFAYWAKPDDGLELSRFLNDDIAATVARHPSRFIGIGTLPMQAPELAVQELVRCVRDLGFRGFQIGTSVGGKNLDDEALDVVWAAAAEHGAVMFIHPWDMPAGGRMSRYWLPWLVGMPYETCMAVTCLLLGGVLDRHPALKLCFAHGAGSFPFTVGRIDHGYQCRPDLVATHSPHPPKYWLGKVWCDSITHDTDALRYLVRTMGPERVVFGTDYPFPLGEVTGSAPGVYPGSALEAAPPDDPDLGGAVQERIMGDNAFDLLGIDPTPYLRER